MILETYQDIDNFITNKEKGEFEVIANTLKLKVTFFKSINKETFNWVYQISINRIKRIEGSYRTKEYLKKHLHSSLERMGFKAIDKNNLIINKEHLDLEDKSISSILTKDRTGYNLNVKILINNKNIVGFKKELNTKLLGKNKTILNFLWNYRKSLYGIQVENQKNHGIDSIGLDLLWEDFVNEDDKSTFEHEIINGIDLVYINSNSFKITLQDYIMELKISK